MNVGISFCTLIVPVACLVGLIYLWARVLRQPREHYARCGQCGYVVEGLTTMACPECGSDFRKVGIATPRDKAVSPLSFFALWTLLLALLALPLGMMMVLFLTPSTAVRTVNCSVSATSGVLPPLSLSVHYEQTRWGGRSSGGTSTSSRSGQGQSTFTIRGPNWTPDDITLQLPATTQTLRYLPDSQQYQRDGSPVAATADRQVITDWLTDAGVDPTQAGFDEDVDALVALVDDFASGRTTITMTRLHFTSTSTRSSSSPSPLGSVAVIAFWLAIYIAGVVIYLRRRRRLFTAPADAAAST